MKTSARGHGLSTVICVLSWIVSPIAVEIAAKPPEETSISFLVVALLCLMAASALGIYYISRPPNAVQSATLLSPQLPFFAQLAFFAVGILFAAANY